MQPSQFVFKQISNTTVEQGSAHSDNFKISIASAMEEDKTIFFSNSFVRFEVSPPANKA